MIFDEAASEGEGILFDELPLKRSYVSAVIVFIIFTFNNQYLHSEMINGLRA
jgi:hypothetical protein